MKTTPQPHQQPTNEFSTKDIYLATVIKQASIPIVRVEGNGRHGIFVFKACPEIEKIISQYFNDQIKVNPRQLFENWKSLKSMAYSAIGDVR